MTTSNSSNEETKNISSDILAVETTVQIKVNNDKKRIKKTVIIFVLPFILMIGTAGTGLLFSLFIKAFQPPRIWD